MVGLVTVDWHGGQANIAPFGPVFEFVVVAFPDPLPHRLDLCVRFELCKQKCGQHVGRKITGPQVYPGIFVHLAAEEARAVRSLLPNYLCAFDKSRVINEQRSAFAARDVLRFVKTLRSKTAEGTKELAAMLTEKSVRIVFDKREVLFASYFQNRLHFTSDTCVVDQHDRAGPTRESCRI